MRPATLLRSKVRAGFKRDEAPQPPQNPSHAQPGVPRPLAEPGAVELPQPALEAPIIHNPNIPGADYIVNVNVPVPQQQVGGAGLAAASLPQDTMNTMEALKHQEAMQRQRLLQSQAAEKQQQLSHAQELTRQQRLLAEQQQALAALQRQASEAQHDAAALAAAHQQEAQRRAEIEQQVAQYEQALGEVHSHSKQDHSTVKELEKQLKKQREELDRAKREADEAKHDAKTLAQAHITDHESNSKQVEEMERQVQQMQDALMQKEQELQQQQQQQQATAQQRAQANRQQGSGSGASGGGGSAAHQTAPSHGSVAEGKQSGYAPAAPAQQQASAGGSDQQQGTTGVWVAEPSTTTTRSQVAASDVYSDVEVAKSPALGVGRAAGTLFAFLSMTSLAGAVAGMSAPGWAAQQLFHVTHMPPEVKLLIIAVSSTLLPVSQALRSLMAASDHQLAGSRTVQQLCYVGLAWGVVCTLITTQAVSLHNLTLLGLWGVTCTATAGVCASVMRKSLAASEAAETLVKGPSSNITKLGKLTVGVVMSCVSMLAPRTLPSLLYAVMSLFFMGVGLVMGVPAAQVELLGLAAAPLHPPALDHAAATAAGGPAVAATVSIFCSRCLTAGLYAASTLAFVLKEAADRHLLQQATPRGLNAALGIMSGVMALVIGTACQLRIAPVNDLSLSVGLGFLLVTAICVYYWTQHPPWASYGLPPHSTATGLHSIQGMHGAGGYIRPVSGFGQFMRSLIGRPPYHTGVVVPPVTGSGVTPVVDPYTGLSAVTGAAMHPGAYPVPGAPMYPVMPDVGVYPPVGGLPYGGQGMPPVMPYAAPGAVPFAGGYPPVMPAVTPPAVAGPVEHAAQVVDDATFHGGMNMPGP